MYNKVIDIPLNDSGLSNRDRHYGSNHRFICVLSELRLQTPSDIGRGFESSEATHIPACDDYPARVERSEIIPPGVPLQKIHSQYNSMFFFTGYYYYYYTHLNCGAENGILPCGYRSWHTVLTAPKKKSLKISSVLNVDMRTTMSEITESAHFKY